jgi:hypothetical protein
VLALESSQHWQPIANSLMRRHVLAKSAENAVMNAMETHQGLNMQAMSNPFWLKGSC